MKEIKDLIEWFRNNNNSSLSVNKIKELIIGFRKGKSGDHLPGSFIDVSVVERVSSFNLLGINILDELFWAQDTDVLMMKIH